MKALREIRFSGWATAEVKGGDRDRLKEIADRMNVTVAAVKWHLQHIYEKLHVHSRTEAALKFKKHQKPE